METEIKLSLRPNDLAKIADLDCVRATRQGPARTRTLVNCYYDSPDGDLVQHGVWLRTRCIGGKWLQTIKMAGDVVGGLHQRYEHEVAIKGPAPDVKALPDLKALAFLSEKSLWKSLAPVIETEFQRTAWNLTLGDGTEVELVADTGEIRAAGRTRDLCELELELKSGNPTMMIRFARTIADEVNVALDSISKAHKGLLLLQGRTPEPVFARATSLAPDASLMELAQAGIVSCFAQIQGNVDAILESDQIEGVHQMRVGLRRLRAAVWGFKKALPGLKNVPFSDDLKWVISLLAPARDLDVIVSTCQSRQSAQADPAEDISKLCSLATERKTAAYAALRKALRSKRFRRLMLDLLVWVHEANWVDRAAADEVSAPGSGAAYARRQLRRGHRHMRTKGDALGTLTQTELHELRIMIKRQRYIAEFAASLFKTSPQPYLKSIKALQTTLGQIQDAHVLPEFVESMVGGTDPITSDARRWCTQEHETARHNLPHGWASFKEAARFWKK